MSLASRVHHRFSLNEYNQMIARGILEKNDRVELIRGEIIDKMPIGPRHIACVNRLVKLFVLMARERWIVSPQNAIELEDSKPEPDLGLLRPVEDDYASSSPQACDVLLVIEVADTSLAFDREDKTTLYAEAGITEYWIVDLIGEIIEVHRHPLPDGSYGTSTIYRPGDRIKILDGDNDFVEVAQIL